MSNNAEDRWRVGEYDFHIPFLALALSTGLAGVVDAFSFLKYKVFVGIQTGNVAFVGMGAADHLPAWPSALASLVAFGLGGLLGARDPPRAPGRTAHPAGHGTARHAGAARALGAGGPVPRLGARLADRAHDPDRAAGVPGRHPRRARRPHVRRADRHVVPDRHSAAHHEGHRRLGVRAGGPQRGRAARRDRPALPGQLRDRRVRRRGHRDPPDLDDDRHLGAGSGAHRVHLGQAATGDGDPAPPTRTGVTRPRGGPWRGACPRASPAPGQPGWSAPARPGPPAGAAARAAPPPRDPGPPAGPARSAR